MTTRRNPYRTAAEARSARKGKPRKRGRAVEQPGDAGTRALAEMAAWHAGRAAGMEALARYMPESLQATVRELVAGARQEEASYRARERAALGRP